MSKASERQAAFVSEVSQVVERARTAAHEVSAVFAAGAKRTAEGYIADSCGGAMLKVSKPSYRLREALKTLGLTDGGYGGSWNVRGNWSAIPDQSVTLEETGAKAAAAVLSAAFPDDGDFRASSYID